MAFALTGFKAHGIDVAGPSRKRGIQRLCFTITATAADVALDLGNFTGTFWSAADNTALGANVLQTVQRIVAQAQDFLSVKSPQLADRIQIATVAGAGEYSLALQNKLPNIAVNAADGETAWYVVVELELNDGITPVFEEYSPST
jgi:hypothetical protein